MELVDYIVQYGVYPVLMAALILVFVFVAKNNKKDKNGENEGSYITREEFQSLQNDISDIKEMVRNGPEHTVEDEEKNRKLNDYIEGQLQCLIDEMGVNRAYMFSYHNGGRDIMGRGFQKMSIMNEMVDSHTPSVMSKYQNVPRTMFPTLFKKLKAEDVYHITNIEDIRAQDPMSYQMFLDHGAKSIFIQAIKRNDGLMIGFIVMEYVSNTCWDCQKAQKNLEKKTLRITGALLASDEEQGGVQ